MKLADIVDQYIVLNGFDTRHNFPRLYQSAILGLKNMNYDVSGQPTVANLTIDDNGLADIPSGLIKIRGIYIMTSGGLVPISESNERNPWVLESNGEETAPIAEPIGLPVDAQGYVTADQAAGRFKNGEFVGGVYAGGGGNPYEYRRNYETNKLEFSSNVGTNVIIDYLASQSKVDKDFVVHPFLEVPLTNWIEWMDKRFKNGVSPSEKERLKRQYFASKGWAKMQFNSQNKHDIRNGQRKGYSLTPS